MVSRLLAWQVFHETVLRFFTVPRTHLHAKVAKVLSYTAPAATRIRIKHDKTDRMETIDFPFLKIVSLRNGVCVSSGLRSGDARLAILTRSADP